MRRGLGFFFGSTAGEAGAGRAIHYRDFVRSRRPAALAAGAAGQVRMPQAMAKRLENHHEHQSENVVIPAMAGLLSKLRITVRFIVITAINSICKIECLGKNFRLRCLKLDLSPNIVVITPIKRG